MTRPEDPLHTPASLNVLIADDQTLFREGLRLLLRHFEAFSDRIYMAGSLDEVLSILNGSHDVHLMLIDLNMPGMQGVLSIRRLAEEYPDVKMLVVSANESPMVMRACLQAGCNGYLTKSAKPSVMLSAIDLVLKGGAYIPREAFTAKPWKFSARQEQLLIQLATGLSNREIAQALGLSEGTVKQYMFALMRQLGVSNRTQACLKAREILGIGLA